MDAVAFNDAIRERWTPELPTVSAPFPRLSRFPAPQSADRFTYAKLEFCTPAGQLRFRRAAPSAESADACIHDRAIGAEAVRFGAQRREPSVQSWRRVRSRGGIAEFAPALNDVPVAPRSSHCANSDDAESAPEAGATVRALAQNLASAAGPGNPGLLAGQRPVS